MFVALAISHFLMPAALTLLLPPFFAMAYQEKQFKNLITYSLSLVAAKVPGKKPQQ
jgi:hypothetical protein